MRSKTAIKKAKTFHRDLVRWMKSPSDYTVIRLPNGRLVFFSANAFPSGGLGTELRVADHTR
jgi:hypothetical protein